MLVRDFFSNRAKRYDGLNAVMLQNQGDIPKKRDLNEKRQVLPLFTLNSSVKVIDIGCGVGRWAETLYDKCKTYYGIDFVQENIEQAQDAYRLLPNVVFQRLSAKDIDKTDLCVKPPFHLIIITGLMVYLNDAECNKLMRNVLHLADKTHAQIYIRESVSLLEERLTLKNFYSEELVDHYNAIYRTSQEYKTLLEKYLVNDQGKFELLQTDLLLKGELQGRRETNQRFFLLERKKN